MEATKGNYSGIDATISSDLAYVAQFRKQLVVQMQYKSSSISGFPAYLQAEANAIVQSPDGNFIPNLWDTTMDVQSRYVALLQQIAAKARMRTPIWEMVNMAESAVVDAATTLTTSPTYTAQAWVNAHQVVAIAGGSAFLHTTFEEYINHISGDDCWSGRPV